MAWSGWSTPVFGALLVVLASAGALQAQAPTELHVQVAHGACPDAALLRSALTPVVDRDVVLVFDEAPIGQLGRRASVSDLGDRYAIEINGARREVDDDARDCAERARVASVFIALNMGVSVAAGTDAKGGGRAPGDVEKQKDSAKKKDDAQAAGRAEEKGDVEEQDVEEQDVEEPYVPPPDRSGIGLIVFGAGQYSTAAERTGLGAGVGAYLATYSFRFELSVAVLSPVELALEPSGAIRGRVQLLRVPTALTASYLLSVGDFQLGPSAGLVLDVLQLEGEGDGLARPQSSLRLNAGVLVGAEVQLWLGSRVGLWARPQLQAFPRAYRLAVDPNGTLGETPRLWLGAQAGLQARFW